MVTAYLGPQFSFFVFPSNYLTTSSTTNALLINFHRLPLLVDFRHTALVRLRDALELSAATRLNLHEVGYAGFTVVTDKCCRLELTQSRLTTRAERFQAAFPVRGVRGGVAAPHAPVVEVLLLRRAVVFGTDEVKLHLFKFTSSTGGYVIVRSWFCERRGGKGVNGVQLPLNEVTPGEE